MATTELKGPKGQIVKYLEGRKARGRAWATASDIARAFGFSSAQPHLNTHIKGLETAGVIARRPAEGSTRARFEFSLEG